MSNTAKGNLLIAQGGGPTAVVNCSLYGVIRQATKQAWVGKIIGARHGIAGLLNDSFIDLRRQSEVVLEGLRTTPGAALGSCRYKLTQNDYSRIMSVLRQHEIRYFLYNGGNDSMDTANKIHRLANEQGYELSVIGVPKTVDNDLPVTDHCPGYGSAARYLAQSVRDLGIDVRSLPTPVSIFETMGRNVGWLAAATALARTDDPDSAPHLIYLPERPLELASFLSEVEQVVTRLGWAVVVVSEGVRTKDGSSVYASTATAQIDGFGHTLPGDVAAALATAVANELKIRCRSEKPGLLGRCAMLHRSLVDATEAEHVGRAAVDATIGGQNGSMITLIRSSTDPYQCATGLAPLADVANAEHLVPDEFIDRERSFVTPAFYQYAAPLIGGDCMDYISLV